jgi:hypothetical protein
MVALGDEQGPIGEQVVHLLAVHARLAARNAVRSTYAVRGILQRRWLTPSA